MNFVAGSLLLGRIPSNISETINSNQESQREKIDYGSLLTGMLELIQPFFFIFRLNNFL